MKNRMFKKLSSNFVRLIMGEALERKSDKTIVVNRATEGADLEQPNVASFLPIMQSKFNYLIFGD